MEVPETTLAAFLQNEHPLIVTYCLSRLSSALSAKVVALLPRELRNEVLVRLLAPPPILSGALPLLESALGNALLGGVASEAGEDNRAKIAEIINNFSQDEVEEIMRAISVSRPQDAKVVRSMLFSFNDLPRLSQRARSLLFDKISSDLVVLALRGTEVDFREPVLSAMASRSRRLVESELSNPSSLPPTEIEKARKQIVKLLLEMAQRGEIDLPTGDETGDDAMNAA
jgi:flagellar motor switch protein FliG